jgi:hypothetical protein
MQHEPAVANDLLVRAARFTAVRLLQIADGEQQISSEMTSSIVGNVQLSLNILQRPIEAIVHLFRIDFPLPADEEYLPRQHRWSTESHRGATGFTYLVR